MILKVIYIDDKRDGIVLHNAKGLSDMEANLESLLDVTKKNDIDIFEIIDGGETSKELLADYMRRGLHKGGNVPYFGKRLYDNFGTTKVAKSTYFCEKKGTRK